MAASSTFLAPGQRYTQPGTTTWQPTEQVTVARLDRDAYGIPRVTFIGRNGQEFVAYAAQIEAAVAAGQIAPVVGAGHVARC